MLTLYKYIHESLLDDEEDLLDNDDAIISQELNQLNKKSDHYSGDENIPIEIAGEGREEKKDYIKVEDNKLLTLNCYACSVKYPAITKYKNYFDTVISAGVNIYGDSSDNFIKKIISPLVRFYDTSNKGIHLSNLDIQLEDWSSVVKKYIGASYVGNRISALEAMIPVKFNGHLCKLNNCSIHMKNPNYGNSGAIIEFDKLLTLPNIKNLESNCRQINMRGEKELFKNGVVLSTLDKVFKTGEYPYGDTRDGLVKKVNGIKDIIAIINNPKKYNTYISRGPGSKSRMSINTDFINEESNLSDAFPWISNLKSLNYIFITNNKTTIRFSKKPTSSYPCTKDGWHVCVEKSH